MWVSNQQPTNISVSTWRSLSCQAFPVSNRARILTSWSFCTKTNIRGRCFHLTPLLPSELSIFFPFLFIYIHVFHFLSLFLAHKYLYFFHFLSSFILCTFCLHFHFLFLSLCAINLSVYFCVLFLSFLVSLFLSFSLAFNFSFSLSFIYSINHRRFWVNSLHYAASCPEDVTCIIAVASMSRP